MIKYRLIIFRKSLFFTISNVDRSWSAFYTAEVISNFYSNYLIQKRLSEKFSSARFSIFMSRNKQQKNATPCQLRNKKAVQLSHSPSFTYLLTPFPFLPKSFRKSPEVGSFLRNRIWANLGQFGYSRAQEFLVLFYNYFELH